MNVDVKDIRLSKPLKLIEDSGLVLRDHVVKFGQRHEVSWMAEDQLDDEVPSLLREQLTYSSLLCKRILESLRSRIAHIST
jgi:hypothetical protein